MPAETTPEKGPALCDGYAPVQDTNKEQIKQNIMSADDEVVSRTTNIRQGAEGWRRGIGGWGECGLIKGGQWFGQRPGGTEARHVGGSVGEGWVRRPEMGCCGTCGNGRRPAGWKPGNRGRAETV